MSSFKRIIHNFITGFKKKRVSVQSNHGLNKVDKAFTRLLDIEKKLGNDSMSRFIQNPLPQDFLSKFSYDRQHDKSSSPDNASGIVVGLRDKMFAHAHNAGNGNLPPIDKGFGWDRSGKGHAITLFTDLNIDEAQAMENTLKIAWMIESPSVTDKAYRRLLKDSDRFDYIFTFNKKILDREQKASFSPLGGCWIEPQNCQVYPKSKNLSIIVSKKASLPGQKLRHKIVRKFDKHFDDVLGSGYRYVENKLDGLKDYRYSIVVENCREDYYFSEKLIDCFMTGTVPIYWGCPSIAEFFDSNGILVFKTMRDLNKIIPQLSETDYQSRLSAIKKNYKIAHGYAVTERHVLMNIKKVLQPPWMESGEWRNTYELD